MKPRLIGFGLIGLRLMEPRFMPRRLMEALWTD